MLKAGEVLSCIATQLACWALLVWRLWLIAGATLPARQNLCPSHLQRSRLSGFISLQMWSCSCLALPRISFWKALTAGLV